ncbi:MAG: ABC transporter permease [Candidatus Ancillula sp.]|nr:ABC transporter permease [Candidatus Ancillula sp.]
MEVLKFVIKSVLKMFLTLFLILTFTFFLLNTVPGDPLAARAEKMSESQHKVLEERYGLNKPVVERYFDTLGNVARGDFGVSVVNPESDVKETILFRAPASIRLGIQQMLLGIPLGMVLGILAAYFKGRLIDKFVRIFSVVIISVPLMIVAILLQRYIAGELGLFPVIGWPKGSETWFGGWKYTVLPTIVGSLGYISSYSRLLRNSVLDTISSEYIVSARARGLSEFKIIKDHVIRNSFIPIITGLPLTLAMGITGSFFVESIFNIPGLGKYYITAVQERDMPMILATTLLLAAIYVFFIMITDICYKLVDPRINPFATRNQRGAMR